MVKKVFKQDTNFKYCGKTVNKSTRHASKGDAILNLIEEKRLCCHDDRFPELNEDFGSTDCDSSWNPRGPGYPYITAYAQNEEWWFRDFVGAWKRASENSFYSQDKSAAERAYS